MTTKKIATKKVENMSLEDSMSELEYLVANLESGDLALDDALKQYERGIALVRESQIKLENAEQKIKILTQKNNQDVLEETSIERLK